MTDDPSNRVMPVVTALAEQREVVRDLIANWGSGRMTAELCVKLEVANGRVAAAMLNVVMDALRDANLGKVGEQDLIAVVSALSKQQAYVDRTAAMLIGMVEFHQDNSRPERLS